jgi:hypothetical protein
MNVTLSFSNQQIIDCIKSDNPFIISRFGAETLLCFDYLHNKQINYKNMNQIMRNCGIYSKSNEQRVFEEYFEKVKDTIKNSDCLACFQEKETKSLYQTFISIQKESIDKFNLIEIHSRSLEPFYIVQQNEIPWSHYLIGKKVLVINPFVKSFQKQMKNNFQIFKDKPIFLENQHFIYYQSFQTHGDNHIHNDWKETFSIMCKDIEKLDFDIALLGCGAYGLPLCNFIKSKLNKSAIYVGGGLQLLFGVMGERWIQRDDWKKIIEENNTKFIRPSGDELLETRNTIENSCYW